MITVYIVEDHEMYVEGLSLLLSKQEDITVLGSSMNATGLLQALPGIQPDILLLDVHLPDMDEETLLQEIRAIRRDQKIIYLTLMRGTRYVHKLLRHQIEGYLLKNAPFEELLRAIKTVHEGGRYFSKEIDVIGDGDFRSTLIVDDQKLPDILSKREIEILRLICNEFSNAEIAEKLFLSVSTIETHRKNIIAKLGVNNTVGLVKFALKNKLID